jgi:hypothetical protein
MTFPYWAWGEENSGILGIEPTYSIQQGSGFNSSLNIIQHLEGKWYLTPQFAFSNLRTYRDTSGKLDLEYHHNDRWTLYVGEGYDTYHHFGDDLVISHDGHAGVKVKLW